MSNKFIAQSLRKDYQSSPDRNTFDVTKRHFGSYDFGKIYPIYCRHLQNSETLTDTPSVILDMETLNHELYNDIRCNIRWFKVNTRTLWRNYRKFARQDPAKKSNIVHPFISRSDADWLRIGSLYNHLGGTCVKYGSGEVNTETTLSVTPPQNGGVTIVSSLEHYQQRPAFYPSTFELRYFNNKTGYNYSTRAVSIVEYPASALPTGGYDLAIDLVQSFPYSFWPTTFSSYRVPGLIIGGGLQKQISPNFAIELFHKYKNTDYSGDLALTLLAGDDLSSAKYLAGARDTLNEDVVSARVPKTWTIQPSEYDLINKWTLYPSEDFVNAIISAQERFPFVTILITPLTTNEELYINFGLPGEIYNAQSVVAFFNRVAYTSIEEVNEVAVNSPFAGLQPVEPLSALPFRAYRAVYNAHFRDKIHNPFRDDNGNIMVDQYVENMEDGADSTTPLDLEEALYDDDYFNTCISSPTMGDDVNRPLVGIVTGSDPNSFELNYNVNGDAYSINVKTHGADGTITQVDTPTLSSHNNDLTYLTLQDAVQYGISLQDLRDKQALSQWYEANYAGNARFTYNDFIKAHFGDEPSLRENLAPEYLGGDTIIVNSSQVLNTSADSTSAVPLGHKGGIASFAAECREFSCRADEDCYVIGVMWLSVDNITTQAMDKMWFLREPIDYATPEFADLGVEPVLMREVAPLQVEPEQLKEVFGYQRIYGDKLYSHDTVAGDFLSEKSDYLMIKRFDRKPELTADFNKIKSRDLTNVFAIENGLDKVYGRFFFRTKIVTWLPQRPNAHIM